MELSPTFRSSIRSHWRQGGIVGESIETRRSKPITSRPSTACRIRTREGFSIDSPRRPN